MRQFIFIIIIVVSNLIYSQNMVIYPIDYETLKPIEYFEIMQSDQLIIIGGINLPASLITKSGVYTVRSFGYENQQFYIDSVHDSVIVIRLKAINYLLENTIITASRFEQKVKDQINSISTLDKNNLNYKSSQDAVSTLTKIPGVQMIDEQVNIRGGSGWSYGSGSRVLVLYDGLPFMQGDAGLPNWSDLPFENIYQVEVLKGAASVLYGSSALNGVVNFRTKPIGNDPQTEIQWSIEIFDNPKNIDKKWWSHNISFSQQGHIKHRQKIGKWNVEGSAFYHHFGENQHFRKGNYSTKFRGNLRVEYQSNLKTKWGINVLSNIGKSASTLVWLNEDFGAYQYYPNNLNKSNSNRWYIYPYWTKINDNKTRYHLNGSFLAFSNKNSGGLANLSYQYSTEFRVDTDNEKLFSSHYGLAFSRISSNSEAFSQIELSTLNASCYYESELNISTKLHIVGGLRYEYYEQRNPKEVAGIVLPDKKLNEDKLVFRSGIKYEPIHYTIFRASYGQGFRFPTIVEKFINADIQSIVLLPNPLAQSESASNLEIGIKQGLKIGKMQGVLDASYFNQRYSNMLEYQVVAAGNKIGFQSTNIGETKIAGIDISIAGKWKLNKLPLKIYFGINYLDPKYGVFNEEIARTSSSSQNILKYRNKRFCVASIESDFHSFNIGLNFRSSSRVEAIDRDIANLAGIGNYFASDKDGHKVIDLYSVIKLNRLNINISINNLLNEEYSLRPGKLENPRSLVVKTSWRL